MNTQADISADSVKAALHAAKQIKSGGTPAIVATIIASGIGFAINPALGMLAIFICMPCMFAAFAVLATRAKCPQCGVKWWDDSLLASTTGKKLRSVLDPNCTGNETKDFRCRNCGLEIAPYLKQDAIQPP